MLKTESYKKGVIYSTGLNIIAKGVQFLNTLTIAFFFGTSTNTDVYFFVISISILITTGMINGIDTIILIPYAMKLRELEGEISSRIFLNFFIFLYILIGLAISLCVIFSPTLFYSAFSKFPSGMLEQNRYLLYAGSLLIFFQLVNNFLGSLLSSYKYFTITILTNFITSLFSIFVTIFFHNQLGVAGTLAAVVTSYGINFLFLIVVMKLRLKWQFGKVTFMRSRELWGNIGLMQLNILPVWLKNYVTLFLLTGLGEGVVSSVNLAQQASSIIDTLIVTQVLSVASIKFNELYAKGDFPSLNEIFIKVANYLLLLIIPVVVVTFFYADYIAVLVFKRGTMGKSSLDTIALCLKYMILLAPFTLLNSICTRIFSSTHVIRRSLLYSMTAHIIFLILTIVFINWLQLKGYLYSLLAGYSVLIFLFYLIFRFNLKQITFTKVLKYWIIQLVINLAIACPVFLTLRNFTGLNAIILLFTAAFIQVMVIGIINRKQFSLSRMTNLLYGAKNK